MAVRIGRGIEENKLFKKDRQIKMFSSVLCGVLSVHTLTKKADLLNCSHLYSWEFENEAITARIGP